MGVRTQSPITINHAVEFPKFEEVAGVSASEARWISLALGKPPSCSWTLLGQVRILCVVSEMLHTGSPGRLYGVPSAVCIIARTIHSW